MGIAIQLIVILAAIAVFVILTVKGLGSIPSAIIASAIVSLSAIGGFTNNLFGTFLNGMASMLGSFFILFSCGVAFGGTLSACGAADRIGDTLLKLMGEKKIIWAIIIITALFGITGAPPIALMPGLCFGLLKRANLPRYIGMSAVVGMTTVSYCLVPGSLGSTNVISASILGGSIYDGAALAIPTLILAVILNAAFCTYLINRARKNGEGYDAVEGNVMMSSTIRAEEDMPSFVCSIIPVIVVLGSCCVFTFAFGLEAVQAVLLSAVIGILLLALLNHKYVHGSLMETIQSSVNGIQWNMIAAIGVCGFAAVIANTDLYNAVIGKFMTSGISPIALIIIAVFILSALCADTIGGVAAFSGTVGLTLVESGVPVSLVQRLACIACGVFDSLPHAGAILLGLNVFGYNHKQAYKYLVVSNIVIPLIYTAFATILAVVIY